MKEQTYKGILPNFLVIGVEKGGTTWLHTQFQKHPDIFLPQTKEVHFFNRFNSNFKERNHYSLGLKWYGDFFSDYKGEKAVGEITPMYICDPEAPNRIKKILPEVKLIAMLRDPVSRAYSHYWMGKNKNHTSLTFKEVIDRKEPKFIERGLYGKQLEVYYSLFDRNNIMITFYEDVFADPKFWLKKMCDFIGIDSMFYENDETVYEKVFQASSYKSSGLLNIQNTVIHALRRNRQMSRFLNYLKKSGVSDGLKDLNKVASNYEKIAEEDRAELLRYYKSDLDNLKELLKRDLPFKM